MNFLEDNKIKSLRLMLSSHFSVYSKTVLSRFLEKENAVTRWAYSMGETENFLPLDIELTYDSRPGRRLSKTTKRQLDSVHLYRYGFAIDDNLIIAIWRSGKDFATLGEDTQFYDTIDGHTVLVVAHINKAGAPSDSHLNALCLPYQFSENILVYLYVTSVSWSWSLRVYTYTDGKPTQMMWYSPDQPPMAAPYNIHYDNDGNFLYVSYGGMIMWPPEKRNTFIA